MGSNRLHYVLSFSTFIINNEAFLIWLEGLHMYGVDKRQWVNLAPNRGLISAKSPLKRQISMVFRLIDFSWGEGVKHRKLKYTNFKLIIATLVQILICAREVPISDCLMKSSHFQTDFSVLLEFYANKRSYTELTAISCHSLQEVNAGSTFRALWTWLMTYYVDLNLYQVMVVDNCLNATKALRSLTCSSRPHKQLKKVSPIVSFGSKIHLLITYQCQ